MAKDSVELNNKEENLKGKKNEKEKTNEGKNDIYINFGRNLKSCNLVSNIDENNEIINKFRKTLYDIAGSYGNNNIESGNSQDNYESQEISLLQNEELPILLYNVFKRYIKNKDKNTEILRNRIEKNKKNNLEESERENIPTYDEFLLDYDSEEGFYEYLLSDECIKGVILNYLKRYAKEDGSLGKVSEKDLMSTIKGEWGAKLWRKYNDTYDLIDDEKYKNINLIFEIGKTIKSTLDKTVYNCILSGGELASQLDSISEFIGNKESIGKYFYEDSLDHLNILLKNSIKEYSYLIDENGIEDKDNPLKKTNDKIFDLQIRSYLYIYGKIFYPDVFKTKGGKIENYESDLNDILLAILMHDGDIKGVKYSKFLNAETQRAKKIAERQKEAREKAFKRNREKNNGIKNREIKVNSNDKERKIDVQTASGADIAREKKLCQGLSKYKIEHNPEDSDMMFLRRTALRRVCTNLINEREDYRNYFSINDLLSFFDIDIRNGGLSINTERRITFKSQYGEDENLPNTGDILFSVLNKYNREKENLDEINDEIKEKCSETIRNHAIGAVIDNIKNIFNELSIDNTLKENEGFSYDENTPVKMENNCMIISGHFRGESVNVSYNVENGEISINSFVSTIGDYLKIGNSEILIGNIEPFQKIFNNFCKKPTDSLVKEIYERNLGIKDNNNHKQRNGKRKYSQTKETNRIRLQKICGPKIDRIGDEIIDEINNKTIINSTVSGMLKTLNILPKYETLLFKKGSDLYYFVQTVQNSAKNHRQGLNVFVKTIPELIKKYLGLTWNMNNEHQIKDESNPIFNPKGNSDGKYDILDYLKENGENFDKEISKIDSAKFDNKENFGLLRIINEKFTKGTPPNQYFDELKIKEFIPMIADNIRTRNLIS